MDEKEARTKKAAEIELGNLDAAKARVAALNKRAWKLGVAPLVLTVGQPYVKKVKVPKHDLIADAFESIDGIRPVEGYQEIDVPFVEVILEGEGPKMEGGWILAARLDRIEDGIVLATVPGMTIDEKWRTSPNECQHCHAVRRRSATYVVKSAAGEEKQVGSDCLKDFLGHDASGVFDFWSEAFGSLDDLDGALGGGGGSSSVMWAPTLLSHVAAMIRQNGWTSRTTAREHGSNATVDAVLIWLDAKRKGRSSKLDDPTSGDAERATAALTWARETLVAQPKKSDYEYNLVTVLARDVIDIRHAGIAASVIPTYERYLGREVERKKRWVDESGSQW